MKQNAGIITEETRLQNGLKWILEIKNAFYSNKNNTSIREFNINNNNNNFENVVLSRRVKSSLIVCEAIIRSALMQEESRGAHYRSDFPKIDDQSREVNIYCRKEGKWISGPAAKMVLLKHNVKEIKGPLPDFLKWHIKAAHHCTFK